MHQRNRKIHPGVDLSIPLMYRGPSDLGSAILFRIMPKECILIQKSGNLIRASTIPRLLQRQYNTAKRPSVIRVFGKDLNRQFGDLGFFVLFWFFIQTLLSSLT